jgi:hypothetical protein
MEFSQDRMTSQELGLSLGILMGIAALQSTGSMIALFALTVVGAGLGLLIGRINPSHQSRAEEHWWQVKDFVSLSNSIGSSWLIEYDRRHEPNQINSC